MKRGELPPSPGPQRSSPLSRETGLQRGPGPQRTTGLQRGSGLARSAPLEGGGELRRTTPLRTDPEKVREFDQRAAAKRRQQPPRRGGISPASDAQRAKIQGQDCIVIGCANPAADPMHVMDRSLGSEGQDDPLAVVGGCRVHHDLYDTGKLDLLPHLEKGARKELAFAVERFGMLAVLRRVTCQRWGPMASDSNS